MITELHANDSKAVYRLHTQEGMTAGQIAKRFNVKKSHVVSIIKSMSREENAPTIEWERQNAENIEYDSRGRPVKLKHPTRLHELCARGTINEEQKICGLRLSVLYVRAGRPQLRAQALYDSPRASSREHQLNNAVDAFFLLIDCQREMGAVWPILEAVCLAELTLDDLSLEIQKRRQVIPALVQTALDELGEWLYKQEPGSV